MITARWLEKRKPYWDELESILQRSGSRGAGALTHHELQSLGLLYRQVAADLASVREDPASRRLAGYLNQLLGRAHNLIYMGHRVRAGGIWSFYRAAFPRIFRATFNYTLSAFAVFCAGGAAGFLVCLGDAAFQRFFLGGAMNDAIQHRRMWTESIVTVKPLASSAIMTNNLTVSFATFALGLTAGLGTVYMLAMNGVLLGVITAACWQAGMAVQLASFAAPHGVLELPAIFLAGGGGLLVARGLLFPGTLKRRDALVYYGGWGVRLALGIIPLLLVAGVIEGFVSPSPLPVSLKFALAGAAGGLLGLYLSACGRE